jgi:membrane protein DedA with SNARE-associated domain
VAAHLDQHVKHWAWLILVVVAVIAVRLWLKHRELRDED